MGPQFSFKTFQDTVHTTVLSSTSPVLLSETSEPYAASAVDVVSEEMDLQSLTIAPPAHHSSPMAMTRGGVGGGGVAGRKERLSSGSSETYGSLPYTAIIDAMDSGERDKPYIIVFMLKSGYYCPSTILI